MKLETAQKYAREIVLQLRPHCEEIHICGSIRRQRAIVNDIEIVCIPKPFNVGLFLDGFGAVVEQWKAIKGQVDGKYTQRLYKGEKVDIFMARQENWGYIMALRTGSRQFNTDRLLPALKKHKYEMKQGMVWKNNKPIAVVDEGQLFRMAQLPWIEPYKREVL